MPARKPYADTRLIPYLEKKVLELRALKSQSEIATEAGFTNVNMMAMIKSGATRLPLDRVPALAEALKVDPARLLQLALDQWGGSAAARAFDMIFETVVTSNDTLGPKTTQQLCFPDRILCESGPASASAKTAVDRGRTDNVLQDPVAAL